MLPRLPLPSALGSPRGPRAGRGPRRPGPRAGPTPCIGRWRPPLQPDAARRRARAPAARRRRAARCALAALPAGLLLATPVGAHDSDYSYLRLRVERDAVEGRWEIHLRDARSALGLPADDEGPSAWARLPELRALLAAHPSLDTPQGPCPPVFQGDLARTPDERDYALVRFRARCPGEIAELRVGNSLLFDLDAEHRAFFSA